MGNGFGNELGMKRTMMTPYDEVWGLVVKQSVGSPEELAQSGSQESGPWEIN